VKEFAMTIALRLLEAKEMEAVHALWKEAGLPFHPNGRDSLERMREEAGDGRAFYLGAFDAGRLIGVAVGTDEGRKGWINRLAILPGYRRKGLASELIAWCENEFARRGRGLVCALVEDWNDASLALMQKEGYALRKDIFYLRKSLRGDDW
jgi:GNAT superfamily N-acetyltransferase